MTEKIITLEAKGEFPFTFCIEKAIASEIEKELILEGVASTTNIDHDNERMSKEALHAMANVINEKTVPLRVEHSKSENAIIGKVFKAWVDERNQMHIRASLDKSHPVSPILHRSMMLEGKKMGFSVGGLVRKAVKEFSDSMGKLVKTFYDVELKEVSVTPRPANYDSWAISKSIAKDEVEAEASRGSGFYDEFLFANPNLDYLQAFAKSVPDTAWQKVDGPSIINKKNNDMTSEKEEKKDETMKADKKEEMEETTKAVSRKEFGTVVKAIETLAKGFEAFVGSFKKDGMNVPARDQNSPNKEKPEDESPAAKAMDSKPHDQNSPSKDKPKDESPAAKSAADGTDTEGEREKSKKDDTYDMETVERSIGHIESLTKRIQGMKKSETEDDKKETKKASDKDEKDETTKADKKDDEETETEKAMHPLDKFVFTITKAMDAMVDRMEKSGMNIIGFQKSIVDRMREDPQLQEEISKMMKMPGQKQSVSLGIPYMVTKEGRRFSLVANEVGVSTIEKSRGEGSSKKSFKDLYKTEFSSVKQSQTE